MRTEPEDEEQAFRQAMSDVRPLPATEQRLHPPKPEATARFARADREAVLRESLLPPEDPSVLDTGEELSFRRPWLREDVLRRLRRGQFAIEDELDLHGLGRHAAHEALREFLADSAARGRRCVRVIHGKGRGSGPRGPVLKHVVNHWLRRMDCVVAFASARSAHGGAGAVYVLLTARRERQAHGQPPAIGP